MKDQFIHYIPPFTLSELFKFKFFSKWSCAQFNCFLYFVFICSILNWFSCHVSWAPLDYSFSCSKYSIVYYLKKKMVEIFSIKILWSETDWLDCIFNLSLIKWRIFFLVKNLVKMILFLLVKIIHFKSY